MAEITWIKLKTDMFDDEKIKLIERMPEGDGILIIWVKLLAYAGKVNCGGYIMISDNIPMNIEEMAIIFNRPLEKVRYAIQVLQRYKMIEVDENETVCIANWEKHQNIEGMEKVRIQTAERNRKYRERKKQKGLQAPKEKRDVSVTSRDSTESESESESELESELDKELKTEDDRGPTDEFAQLVKFYEQNIGILYPTTAEHLGFLLDDYKDVPLILEALHLAVTNQARNKLKYAEATLKNWKDELITTIAQLQAKEAQVNAKHQRSNASHTPKTPAENNILQVAATYTSDISKYENL